MSGQFDLTDDQREIQELARRFTADRITPFAAEWDERSHYPVDVWKAAGKLGFGAIYVSEESGGIALGRLEAALIMEAMSYGCPATSAFISIHNMAAWMIDRFGFPQVKARFLPDLVSMDKIASYCLTEPGSGFHAAALKTTARRDGDHYVFNGTKQFISGAGYNHVYVVLVRTSEEKSRGITAIVVEKDTPGLSFGAPEKKLGWNASPTAQVIFEDCFHFLSYRASEAVFAKTVRQFPDLLRRECWSTDLAGNDPRMATYARAHSLALLPHDLRAEAGESLESSAINGLDV